MSVYVYLLAAAATPILPFLLGSFLGKKLRMPEHGWKIGICLFSLVASVVILWLGPQMKYGVDLRGGVILVYEVDKSKMEAGQNVDMGKLIAAISKRINPGGQKEVTIRPAGLDLVEIIIPEVDEAEVARVESIISRTGTLEFRIVANQRDHKSLIERATAEPVSVKIVKDAAGDVIGWWAPVQAGQEGSFSTDVCRTVKRGNKNITEVLICADPYNVTGMYLDHADRDVDEKGKVCVSFTFNEKGGNLFHSLTSENLPDQVQGFKRRLAILLDGELYSAPTINSAIGSRGQISGDSFTEQSVKDEVNVLNAGSLPTALSKEPISRLYSGATLGQDTIQKSWQAMLIACILVPLFMLWYYRFAGIVADIALVLNILMLIAIMVMIKAPFTLTGLAGIALAVGMAVDNNVLVYERLREEMERGATLRMAIRNAFQRASATIIDCNLSHLISTTVLYVVGTDQIRGFAVTLWLGVAISMYTSVFVARVIFDIADKRQWIKQLKMMHLVRHTHVDFMHWFPTCATASILITLIGLAIAVHRGKGLFDIDFTGGVSVQAQFNEPQKTAEVRAKLSEVAAEDRLPDLAISDVRMANQEAGLQFVVNTSEQDLKKVQQVVAKTFGDRLARNSLTFSEPAAIQAAAKQESPKTQPAAEKPAAETPAAPAPATDKPAEKPADAEKNPQSRNDLPSDRLLAMAGSDVAAAALALGDPAAEKPAEKAEGSPAEPASTASPTSPAATTPAAPVADSIESLRAAFANSPEKGSESNLAFKTELDYKAAEDQIKAAMPSVMNAGESATFQLFNPEYVEGEAKKFKDWILLVQLPPDKTKQLLEKVQANLHASPFFPASNSIGGAVAGSTCQTAVIALIASWAGIIIYLWVRFQGVAFGVAAVLSLIHDILIMLGAVAISYYIAPWMPSWLMIEPFKINLPIIAAFLTIIGYSVNDTIVVFDRIREVRGKDPKMTRQMVNSSTNQTLSRTLLTSLTVLLVVVVLYFWGGDALHGFAFSLIIGVLTGTYSSIYVAAPTLIWILGHAKNHGNTEAKSA
jgi:SecD/SecF fusion protein